MNSLYRFAALCLFLGGSAVRAAPPEGVPNQSFSDDEVFSVISAMEPFRSSEELTPEEIDGHVGFDPSLSLLVNGYPLVYSALFLTMHDLSDPYAPKTFHAFQAAADLSDPWYGGVGNVPNVGNFSVTTAYGGAHIVYMDSTKLHVLDYAGVNPDNPADPAVEGFVEVPKPAKPSNCPSWRGGLGFINGYDWQPPRLFSSMRLIGIDISTVPFDNMAGGTHTLRLDGWCEKHGPGVVTVIGNLLVFSSGEGRYFHISTYDISDPENPVELDHMNKSTFKDQHPDKELANTWQGYLHGDWYFTSGDKVDMWDISDPTSITYMRSFSRDGGCEGHSSSGGVAVQDKKMFFGASCKGIYKWDLETGDLVGKTGAYVKPGETGKSNTWDTDYLTVFGNIVLASSEDHYQATFIVPHQAEPDNTPPTVNRVVPENGAVDRNVKSRVGISFTDNIDHMHVNGGTIKVIHEDGTEIPGHYAVSRSIANFTPAEELSPNTSYAVCVPSNGVRDYAGNPTDQSFLSYFSTGSSVEEFECECEGGTNVRLSGSRLRSEIGTRTRIMPVMDRDASRGIGGAARLYDMRGRSVSGSGEALRNLQKGVYISTGGSGR